MYIAMEREASVRKRQRATRSLKSDVKRPNRSKSEGRISFSDGASLYVLVNVISSEGRTVMFARLKCDNLVIGEGVHWNKSNTLNIHLRCSLLDVVNQCTRCILIVYKSLD
jgi:hypothetical protein